MKLSKDYTELLFSFLVNDTILPSDNPLRISKNLLKRSMRKSKQSIKRLRKTNLNAI